ncbi:uncharacterized protein C6orf132 homolog [Lithobates pipiens]
MKKNSSMQGTLNKLFGKKNNSQNSLYAENPPWMKPQGVKKTSVDYHDDIHNSFAFLDDSGTATLKARPGPRARPLLQFSNSNTDAQGLAVPTPSVPTGYSDNLSIGNGSKLNGNYRMYSSVGDLRLTNYYDEEIPAPPSMPPPPPPSMPPPPPPTMIPAAPPQESPPSFAPISPSLPDFIPPMPHTSATTIPNFEPLTDTSTAPKVSEQRQTDNVSKWKSEGSKDMPMTLPNRFSLNSAGFQHSQGQTTKYMDPHSSLPKTFKVPPPAPMRTSSIQLQEYQNISYSTDPPQSPVPSSFNPGVQAKLFLPSNQEQKTLNDALNKRKSMLIMDDLQDLSQMDAAIQRNDSITDSNKIYTNDSDLSGLSEKMKDGSKRPLSSIEFNKMAFNKDAYLAKERKDAVKVLSVKPIVTDMSLSNTNVQLKQNSLTRDLEEMKNKIKMDKDAEIINQEAPPTPPFMPPPPPPPMTPPKPPAMPPPPPPPPPHVTVTPQNNSHIPNFVAPPPAPPLMASMPPVPQASPLHPPKPKTISASTSQVSIPPPAPPKAPPAPPPLPSQTGTSTPEPQLPLLKALQEKQQTLKQIPKKPIDIRPAQVSSVDISSDNEQKARVGKIKGELEALFSPKKDEKLRDLKSLETNKKSPNGNTTQKKSGENTLVNSLMMKVPHIPSVSDKEDADGDTSDWIPKSNNTNFQIPEPDYLPVTPTQTIKKPTYPAVQNNISQPIFEVSSKPAFSQKATDVSKKINDIPAYKPHHERNVSTGSLTLDKLSLTVSETTAVGSLKKDEEVPYPSTSLKLESLIKQGEGGIKHPATSLKEGINNHPSTSLNSESFIQQDGGIDKHPVTGEQVEANSPMALLLAAKKRAQRGNRSMPPESSNMPKISVSSGIVASPLTSQYNDVKANTFVVVPKKENGGQFSEEEVTSFSSKSSSNLGNVASFSRTDKDFPSSSVNILGLNPQKANDEKTSWMHGEEKTVRQVPMDRNEDFWNVKSSVIENHNSPNRSNFMDAYTVNISSVPSPVPASNTYEDSDYGIIPPPAEFMNTPPSTHIDMHQKDRLFDGNKLKSNLGTHYDWNNESTRPLGSQRISYNSDFNKPTSDNYSTGIGRDPQKGSLIKKRLYMPAPESSGSYGKNTHSLRSSALPGSYSHMYTQSSSSMNPESRRSGNPSRYMSQGRRMSSENMVQNMTDMKYRPQNPEYGKSTSRSQNTHQQGMTFTVRPGTRQPISQMYQGGYL